MTDDVPVVTVESVTAVELSPCPFCGGEADMTVAQIPVLPGQKQSIQRFCYSVACRNPKCAGSWRMFGTVSAAQSGWNERTITR